MRKSSETIGKDVLAFLSGNYLDPTPMNYRFAYYYLNRSNKTICDEVDNYVENGMRIQQDTIKEMMADLAESNEDREEQISARDEAVQVFLENAAKLTTETRDEASSMERSIAEESKIISEGASGAELFEAVERIVAQAKQTERELATRCNQIDRLQRDLEEARNCAYVDELTRIPNRRSAHRRLSEIAANKTRYSLAIVDIDNFKSINDKWGHQVGDRAINLVATHLQDHLGPWMVARWGGEEFLIIAEVASHEKLADKIEKAKAELRERKVKVRETDEPLGQITFSAGVVSAGEISAEEAIHQADGLLYRAKREGRDRVYSAGRNEAEDLPKAA